jgi:ribosomal protein S18 acetylase RimI-like enzyme
MSNNYNFRIATEEDAPHLQNLIEAAFRFTDASIEWIGSPDLAKTFTMDMSVIVDRIASPENVFLIASDTPGGPAIACVNVFKKTPDYGRIALLAVDPTIQRGGLGKTVMNKAEKHLTGEFGVKRIGLNALETRKGLIAWYERQGYAKTGDVTRIPVERFADKEIELVEFEKSV